MRKQLDDYLPYLIEELSNTESTDSIDIRWQHILHRFFTQTNLAQDAQQIDYCQLINNDQSIQIPTIDNISSYKLTYIDSSLVFSEPDIKLADALLKLTRQFISIQQAIEQGASNERHRIARDLHDDVAARMLTLIHQAKDQHAIKLARSILKSLRNAIYTLDNKSTTTALDALTDIRSELQDRLNPIGMQIFWLQCESIEKLIFTPRQHINLHRIMHEVVTNVIRHAAAEYVTIDIKLEDNQFLLQACDNGTGFNMEDCIPGKGINNISTRIKELNGKVSWINLKTEDNDNTGSSINICFPIII